MQLEKESGQRNQHISDLWSYFFSGPEMTPLPEQPVAEQPHKVEEENKENVPANEKTDNYYKGIKQCKLFKLIAIHIQKLIGLV